MFPTAAPAATQALPYRSGLLPGLALATLVLTSTGCALFGAGDGPGGPSSADRTDARAEAGAQGDDATGAVPPADAGFDLNAAIQIAGSQVPQGVESFYFLVIDDTLAEGEDVRELRRLLLLAAESEEFLGIVGPRSARNLRVVRAALDATEAEAIDGLQIIYLGPSAQIDPLSSTVEENGVGLHFMVYPTATDKAAQPRRLGP